MQNLNIHNTQKKFNFFTGGYEDYSLDFAISKLSEKIKIPLELHGILAIQENIMFRGETISLPSNLKKNNYTKIDYQFIFIFQIILIYLLRNNILHFTDKSWDLNIIYPHFNIQKKHILALKELELWITQLYKIQDKTIKFPPISLSENGFKIIFELDKEASEDTILDIDNNEIHIRRYKESQINKLYRSLFNKNNSKLINYNVSFSDFRFNPINLSNSCQTSAIKWLFTQIFHFKDFKIKQLEIICKSLNPQNAIIGIMPTGSGKSVCFQFVSLLTPGITIVISPLNSLMEDQCNNLMRNHKISCAVYLNSSNKNISSNLLEDNRIKMVYVSPERFLDNSFKNILKKGINNIAQIVIDEVHCLSEWGHDFRTSYLLLLNILKELGITKKCLLSGLTATSSFRVTQDIENEFKKLKNHIFIEKTTYIKRDNLKFNVIKTINLENEICDKVVNNIKNNEKTVVFTAYSTSAEKIASNIQYNLNSEERKIVDCFIGGSNNSIKCERFKDGKLLALVATKAFGMGLDIRDIRHIIHLKLSSSVESFYQEVGRAGRDGKPSICSIFIDDRIYHDLNCFSNTNLFTLDTLKQKSKFCNAVAEQVFLLEKNNVGSLAECFFTYALFKYIEKKEDASFSQKEAIFEIENSNYLEDDDEYSLLIKQIFAEKNISYRYKVAQNIFEKSLYKLFILGVINLWEAHYENNDASPLIFYDNIKINKITPEQIKQNLEKYIKSYEPEYQVDTNTNKKDFLISIIYELSDWSYKNFFLSRWNSLATLNDWIFNFNDSTTFENHIEDYFSDNEGINKSILNPLNYEFWFENLIQEKNKSKLKDQLLKKRDDGYSNNLAIDYMLGLLGLNEINFFFTNEYYRLTDALNKIEKLSKNNEQYFEDIFDRSVRYLDNKQHIQNYLSVIFDQFPYLSQFDFIHKFIKENFIDEEVIKNNVSDIRLLSSLSNLNFEIKNFMENKNGK